MAEPFGSGRPLKQQIRRLRVAFLVVLVAVCSSAPSGGRLRALHYWRLPPRLNEISDLAIDERGRLFANDDERGIVYQLDADTGAVLSERPIADPVPRADFEGLTILGDSVYLITSGGILFVTPLGGGSLREIDTGIGRLCEIEGLTHRLGRLVAVCKQAVSLAGDAIHLVSFDVHDPAGTSEITSIPVGRPIRPSGIAWDGLAERYRIVAARPGIVVTVDDRGAISCILTLDRRRHRGAEGIAIDAARRLVIADEAHGGRARLTVYRDSWDCR